MKKLIAASLLLLASSCTFFINNFDDKDYEVLNMNENSLSLVFSHNIHGETHPCGCRQFPLGGLPQVNGVIHEIKKTGDVVMIDTGDMLFASPEIPKSMTKSLTHAARGTIEGMTKIGLNYFLPGEQDLTLGWNLLKDFRSKYDFHFLISNLKDPKKIKHKRWTMIEKGPHQIYLIGMTDPEVFTNQLRYDFEQPAIAMPKILEELKKNGYDSKNPFHRLILLSHAGMDNDEALAKKFPMIDWIIGSHSQSFTRFPREEGKTKIVQVLSQNHYLGEIKINLTKSKDKDTFALHETRDEKRKLVSPNPLEEFVATHKSQMTKIQEEEQGMLMVNPNPNIKMMTTTSCLDCHEDQAKHWQQTAHSMAYQTLLNLGEENNLQCVKCHSVGLGSPNGFSRTSDLTVHHESLTDLSYAESRNQTKESLAAKKNKILMESKKKYWNEVREAFSGIKSVRKLSKVELQKHSQKWLDIDEKYKVTHNFANVQCMNCHNIHFDHPFTKTPQVSKQKQFEEMRKRCISCHDPDQSPQWYKKTAKGLPGDLDETKLIENIRKISCPKYEE